ncbi:MAG TPA: sulfatase-like hydrolase/transferase [Armatimonadota bacterium]|nr:sulfatase-like hydrolase/transferase [Armatimonadota bacterium]
MNDMRPNILIIHADQHRWDCLGCAGNADVRTPHIDALARDGIRYAEHFCPFPVCTPSRYSFLTGLSPHQHTGVSNHCTIPEDTDTFPKVLRQAGYRTQAVGKMHCTPTYLDVGFDTMVLAEQDGPGRYDDDYHRYLREQGLVDALDLWDQVAEYRQQAPREYQEAYATWPSNLGDDHYSTTRIGNRAV